MMFCLWFFAWGTIRCLEWRYFSSVHGWVLNAEPMWTSQHLAAWHCFEAVVLGLPFFRPKLRRHRHPQTLNYNLDRSASLVFDTVNRVVGVEPLLSGLLGREGGEPFVGASLFVLSRISTEFLMFSNSMAAILQMFEGFFDLLPWKKIAKGCL